MKYYSAQFKLQVCTLSPSPSRSIHYASCRHVPEMAVAGEAVVHPESHPESEERYDEHEDIGQVAQVAGCRVATAECDYDRHNHAYHHLDFRLITNLGKRNSEKCALKVYLHPLASDECHDKQRSAPHG